MEWRTISKWSGVSHLLIMIGLATTVNAQQAMGIGEMQKNFQSPPDDARIMMRWWWFGPAVAKQELTRELQAMKDAGIGGVEIQAMYPVVLDDAKPGLQNLPFLSAGHLDALKHANEQAHALGLRVDLTLGSGWPYGGPSVSIEEAAGRLRVERIKLAGGEQSVAVPRLEGGEKFLAAFLVRRGKGGVDPEGTRELAGIQNGIAPLPSDLAGANEVMFFISSRTKQQVKRPSVGAEGFVLNHYDRAAVEAYLRKVGDPLVGACGTKPPYAIFCDSLELYESDWTPDFLEEFQKRRGYDLKPYLPALVDDFGPRTKEIRCDWGRTLTELLNEHFVQPVRDWAQKKGTCLRMQAYGIPPATLSTNRLVDLPEGEGADWRELGATRWASSASHIYGRPVTSSETWTWLHSPSFRATPLDMKVEADLHFLEGINQLIGHGWPYSAPGVDYPGWRLYAAGALNDKNPWWIVMPDLTRYLQRVSWLLRQGQPANDVAIYLPNSDAWANLNGKSIHQHANLLDILRDRIGGDVVSKTLEAGFGFDFFDDEALRETGKVESGALALGSNKYRIVILPNVERLPVGTLRKLEEFVRGGGVLIATRRLPDKAPGFKATDAENDDVRQSVNRLFEGAGATAHFVADEKAGLPPALASLIGPDVNFSSGQSKVGFVHRKTPDAEIYFIANTGPERSEMDVTFRVDGLRPEWWNPFTGLAEPASTKPGESGGVTLPIELEPYESRVVVFTRGQPAKPQNAEPASAALPAPIDLGADWKVSFDHGPTLTMDKLHSWTDDEATRNFSGLATYEKEIEVPRDFVGPATRVEIDFGPGTSLRPGNLKNGMRAWIDAPVGEAAVVYVNGQRAGSIWRPPYRLDLTSFLKPGRNSLKIVVGNTAINHMAGHPMPDYKALNARFGERFKPQDMDNLKPIPSGLIGSVSLVCTKGGQ